MVKKIRVLISIALIGLLLFGCMPNDEQRETNTPNETVSGGILKSAENINVKDIDITLEGNQTVITISMLSGSRTSGYAESKLVKLPKYEIEQLGQPQRLMVRLHNISFWDYEEQKPTWALSDFVTGLFHEVPADNDTLILYIQLSRNADVIVDEADGELVIRLTPANTNEIGAYFCAANAFFEHQEGTWPDNIDMQPVLCSDGTNKLLISSPFETREQAIGFMEDANDKLKQALMDKTVYVIELSKNALPDFERNPDNTYAEGKKVVLKDNVLIDTPMLLQNGKYLATAPDGRIAFSRRYKPDEQALEENKYLISDKLWIQDPNGRTQALDVDEFYSIDKAAFSNDNNYLCILDVSIDNKVLYVYDFNAKELKNLGEEGFGDQTVDFAWSDIDNTLYAMSGTDNVQLMACEFTDEGTRHITAVEETKGGECEIEVSNGKIFLADKTNKGVIYEIGETRREITKGVDFRISPDGKTMLVLEAASHEGEQVSTNLKLCDINTGKSQYIEMSKHSEIMDFYFSQNGSKVYYTDVSIPIEDTVDGYIYGLFSYDILGAAGERVALTSTTEFVPGDKPGQIYLIEFVDDNYATFIYDLSL